MQFSVFLIAVIGVLLNAFAQLAIKGGVSKLIDLNNKMIIFVLSYK